MRTIIGLVILALVLSALLKLFGIRTSFNLLPLLRHEEKVLFLKRWVPIGSVKSLPTYRWWVSLPPFVEHGLYVTNRRILHVFIIFRLLKQEHSQWFHGKQEPEDEELFKEAEVGRSLLLGPYVDVVSENVVKRWWRSRRCRLRLFMRDPESVYKVISAISCQHQQCL